jgi:hypothetical protein
MNGTTKLIRLLVITTAVGASGLVSSVRAMPAHADCIMVGQANLSASGVAEARDHSVQMHCDGAARIRGWIADTACDRRHAVAEVHGFRGFNEVWVRRATADGCGNATQFDFTQPSVDRMQLQVWAENTFGLSSQATRDYFA